MASWRSRLLKGCATGYASVLRGRNHCAFALAKSVAHQSLFRIACGLLFCLAARQANGAEPVASLTYNRDIRPILADNCFRCHGADSASRKADLRLDQRTATIDSGAITPGQPEESELLRRILSDDPDEVMPPPETRQVLSAAQKAKLRQWIADGATYEEHWSFVPPVKAVLPTVDPTLKVDPTLRGGKSIGFASRSDAPTWNAPLNAIDYFVRDRLSREGLTPSREATRTTLIRRLSLDLTGLPPTLAEVAAFVADESDVAYEQLVDRLLESPRYGEHMARSWLDAARYADSNGYQYDTERTMWPWREWVIQAF
ncbi:MAG: DUF1549 domain-containing protein, partial [Planctomycetales bacterium]|nr:DUF1549 domain-containing protein [Planctomycetales bacterium]